MRFILAASLLHTALAGTTVRVSWPTDFVLGTYTYTGRIGQHHFPWDPPSTDQIIITFPQLPVDAGLFAPAVLGIASLTVQAVAHVSTSGSCKWNAVPPIESNRDNIGVGWGPQFSNCTEARFSGSTAAASEFTITVHNSNLIEDLQYAIILYYGCASGTFYVDNSLCSPVKLLPQGIYESACAYNLTTITYTAINGCNCNTAQQNFLGCWDKSGLSAPPAPCLTNTSNKVAACSDCSASCPQPK
jgi:hypothetical protein